MRCSTGIPGDGGPGRRRPLSLLAGGVRGVGAATGLVLLLAAGAGCSSGVDRSELLSGGEGAPKPSLGSSRAGTTDGGTTDGGTTSTRDTDTPITSTRDSGTPDSGTPDSGTPASGVPGTGAPTTGSSPGSGGGVSSTAPSAPDSSPATETSGAGAATSAPGSSAVTSTTLPSTTPVRVIPPDPVQAAGDCLLREVDSELQPADAAIVNARGPLTSMSPAGQQIMADALVVCVDRSAMAAYLAARLNLPPTAAGCIEAMIGGDFGRFMVEERSIAAVVPPRWLVPLRSCARAG